MNVYPIMEDVVMTVSILLVALRVHVTLDMSWILMEHHVLVRLTLCCLPLLVFADLHINPLMMQTSMSVLPVMEDVVVPVLTLLVATTVLVPLAVH